MAITKMHLKTSGNSDYGFQAEYVSHDGKIKIPAGRRLEYDPNTVITPRLTGGFLFRNPEMKNDDGHSLTEIWNAIQNCDGKVKVSVDYDDKSDKVICYIRFTDSIEATSFILSSDTFEKWSDELNDDEKEQKKKAKGNKLKVNADGTVTVNVTVETLGDEDPD